MSESRHSAPEGKLRLLRFGGAAVPAVLVGVSVLLVLLVVLIQSVMNGGGGANVVPLGGGSPPAVDQGQVADGQTQSGPNRPSGSAKALPSKFATPKPGASATPIPPTVGITTPGVAPSPFGPVSIEAESGVRQGIANISSCATCSGGAKVGHIGDGAANYVTLSVSVPSAATYRLTVTYELDTTTRTFLVAVNGTKRATLVINGGAGWTTPASQTTTIPLVAGGNSIKFYNDTTSYAPDLDKITLGP